MFTLVTIYSTYEEVAILFLKAFSGEARRRRSTSAAPRHVLPSWPKMVTLGGFDSSEQGIFFQQRFSAETFIGWLRLDRWRHLTGIGRAPFDFAAGGDVRDARCRTPGRSAADMQLTSASSSSSRVFGTRGCSCVCHGFDSDSAYRNFSHELCWLDHAMTGCILTFRAHGRPRSSRSGDAVHEPSGAILTKRNCRLNAP